MSITVVDAIARIRPEGMSETVGGLSLISRGLALLPLAAIGAGAALVKMGMDAQTQLSIVAGLTGSSAAQMRFYTSSLEAMGAKFGLMLDQAAKGLYFVVSAGYKGADAITVLTTAMQHAAATGVPLQDVSRGLASAMNAYGASAKDATRYSDMITTSITYGVQTTADFANNVSKAALMAASAHIPFAQLAAAEAALTEKGEPANRAFTELSFMISKIAVPSADAMAKSVSALGGHLDATAYQSADLMGKLLLLRNSTGLNEDAFLKLVGGTRSARGALGLLSDQGAAYDKILQYMANDSGVTAAAFDIHTHAMAFAFERVKASISNAGFALVQMISPAAITFLGKIADQAGRLPDMFTAIGAVVGPVFSRLFDSVTKVDAPVTSFRDHVAGINTVTVTTKGMLSNLADYLTTTFGPAWQKISTFVDAQLVPALKRFADFVLNTVIPDLQKLWQWFSANILPILLQFAGFILNNVIPALQQMWVWFNAKVLPILEQLVLIIAQHVIPFVEGLWSTITKQLVPALQQLWEKIGPVLIPIFQLMGWWMEHITGPVINGLIHAISALITAFGWIVTQIGNVLGWIGDKGGGLLGKLGDLKDWLGAHIPGASWLAQTAISALIGPIKGVIQWIGNFVGAIGGLIGKFGDLIGKIGDALDALNRWNKTPAMDKVFNAPSGNAGTPGGGRHAQGGWASGMTLVGEQGPEWAVFPPGTNIIPTGMTRAIANSSDYGGGSGWSGIPNVPININIGGTRVAQILLPELVAAMRHGGAIRQ